MPRAAVGAFIGAAVIVLVLLYSVGTFDSAVRSGRIVAGACDIPEYTWENMLSLTTTASVPSGYYDSLGSPAGSPYTVPSGHELLLCGVEGIATAATSTLLQIGYADTAVSATSTPPAVPVVITNLAVPAVNDWIKTETFVGVVPAGKIPWGRHNPAMPWAFHVVGILRKER